MLIMLTFDRLSPLLIRCNFAPFFGATYNR